MKPVEFEETNAILGKGQEHVLPFPALILGDEQGTVVSCWELSEAEVAEIVKTRRLWLLQWTFGTPLQPQMPSACKPFGAQGYTMPIDDNLPTHPKED